MATIAFYGPDLSHASKVVVGIIRTAGGDAEALQTWLSDIDVRRDMVVGQEVTTFIEHHGARTGVMAEQLIGCPHQQGVGYEGDWCPVCRFWQGRDRFTGQPFS